MFLFSGLRVSSYSYVSFFIRGLIIIIKENGRRYALGGVTAEQKVGFEEGFDQEYATAQKLFGKWSYEDLKVEDPSLVSYIAVTTTKSKIFLPHSAGKWQAKRFHKAACPLVERLVNSIMKKGRNTGKKQKAVLIVKQALEIVHLLTGNNPIQVLIDAVCNSGAREDSTRIGSGGVVRRQAVDVSPLRRVNQALSLMSLGSRKSAFRSIKTISECLADEIMNAAKGSANSHAIKKKDEIERVAKGNR